MEFRAIKTERTTPARGASPKSAPALLAEPGRVLAAEVVKSEGDSKYVLSVGREQVQVKSERPLQVGDRLPVRVERDGAGIALRAVEGTAQGTAAKDALVRLLSSQQGLDRDLGRSIKQLLSTLQSGGSNGAAQGKLQAAVQGRVVEGALNGRALASLLTTGGSNFEARLFQLVTSADAGRSTAELTRDAASALLGQLTSSSPLTTEGQARYGAVFETALQSLLSQRAPAPAGALTRANIRRFFTAYARELLSAVSRQNAGDAQAIRQRSELSAGLRTLLSNQTGPGFLGPLLRRLLGGNSQVREALLQQLSTDLKGKLLAALAGGLSAGEKEQVGRVLEAVEQEQARNVARSENDDSRQWSLVVQDGAELATLKVFRRRSEAGGEEEGQDVMRFSLGIEFSQLGPIRADLRMDQDSFSARLTVSEVHTARLIRGDVETLSSLLSTGGRSVSISVVEGSPAQASVDGLERDIRFLDENHLLDLSA